MKRHNRIRWLTLVLAGLMFLSGCSGGTDPPASEPTVGNFGGLVCLEYSRFTGSFPEDGSGRQVSNVAALRVLNSSDQFLDYAVVECKVGDRDGTFEIKGLPPGGIVWVMEKDALSLSEGDPFYATKCDDYVFRPDAIMSTDRLSVTADGDTLTVTNRSDKTLENVCVYYKSARPDGDYLGGISYMLGFGTLAPGDSARKQSGHFGEGSKIVRYSFQES